MHLQNIFCPSGSVPSESQTDFPSHTVHQPTFNVMGLLVHTAEYAVLYTPPGMSLLMIQHRVLEFFDLV
jgi:hypothetical protein